MSLAFVSVAFGARAEYPAQAYGEPEPTYPPPAESGYPPPEQQGYPPPASSPGTDRPTNVPAETHEPQHAYRKWAVELNPAAIFIERYSVNVEWMPALHHAIIANPHFDTVSTGVSVRIGSQVTEYEEEFWGGGIELGYRFYTGRKSFSGFFAGPSLLFSTYSVERSDITGSAARNFTTYGFAFDVGGQALFDSGFVVGGGFGLQRTWVSGANEYVGDLPLSAEVLVGGGIRPRLLFSVGFAFGEGV